MIKIQTITLPIRAPKNVANKEPTTAHLSAFVKRHLTFAHPLELLLPLGLLAKLELSPMLLDLPRGYFHLQ